MVWLQLTSAPIVLTELLLANATDTSHQLTGTDTSHQLNGTDTSNQLTGTDTSNQLNGTDAGATDQNTSMDLLLTWNHPNLMPKSIRTEQQLIPPTLQQTCQPLSSMQNAFTTDQFQLATPVSDS